MEVLRIEERVGHRGIGMGGTDKGIARVMGLSWKRLHCEWWRA